jgi:hypothetical protein
LYYIREKRKIKRLIYCISSILHIRKENKEFLYYISTLHHIKILSPMRVGLRCVKAHRTIHYGGINIKIKKYHAYIFPLCVIKIENPKKILNRPPAKILALENLSKLIRRTNSYMADR